MSYATFLKSKVLEADAVGFDVDRTNPDLFDFQDAILRWALHRGRAAIWADCGLGKTPMQLEWAWHVLEKTGKPVLIFAPLAVSGQTQREGEKFGVEVNVCREAEVLGPGVNITNYERLERFTDHDFGGIVLDESSILKGFDGQFRRAVTNFGRSIPYRLACTATPAPNDLMELTNHAEFLGVMTGKEMMALFFIQDGNTTHKWRLKRHAERDFWRWLSTWAVALRQPSDLGFADDRFSLPPLDLIDITVEGKASEEQLFGVEAQTLMERRAARRASLEQRVAECAALVNASDETWVVWCDLNAESEALTKAIPGAVEVKGSDPAQQKESRLLGFAAGEHRVIVTKPSIAGFGLNWQHCHNVAFVGLSDSYEQFYQAIRRCWRFGQEQPVKAYLIAADTEGAVRDNIARKERQAKEMMENVVSHMETELQDRKKAKTDGCEQDVAEGEGWTLHLGDCMDVIQTLEDESVGLSVFSPPFPGMYAYTDSPRDVGNSRTIDELIEHFGFLMEDLLRITKPGRSAAVHLTQAVAFKGADGYIGIKDFRGRVIEAMESRGWIYYGEVCIEKDPQVKAIRTKDAGLLFKSLAEDSARMHMALADYLLQFRKPGENADPIRAGVSAKYGNDDGWITAEEWIEWAAPVWYRQRPGYPGGIRETNVLNVRQARDEQDEKHLCPLQLDVIERAVKLWSAPGELVFSPFAGIGSEGHVALQHQRKFVGVELKRSYWEAARQNLSEAVIQPSLLAGMVDG